MDWIKHQKVAASLTDYNADLSVLGAFQIMEDAVTEFMGDLKIDGLTAKREHNAVWVFSKTKMRFFKNIAWNEEYTVTCFFSQIANATINVDVGVKNAADELCIYTKTEICALDLTTGRIRKVSTVGIDGSFSAQAPLADISFERFDEVPLPAEERVKIGYTNIDYAVHTNNKEYVRFMLNTYSVRQMRETPIRELEIVYANQSFEGDELTVRKGSFGNKDIFEIQKDDKTVVKCAILRADG